MEAQKEKEFEQYYQKYYAQVYRYIYKKALSEETAEDLTMDVFYAVWAKFDGFDEQRASFQTWLYVIVNNKLKNHYRDKKESAPLDDSLVDEHNPVDDVVEAMQLQYLRDCLYDALQVLNETQRQIVIYKYFRNLNAGQIGYHMGLSPGNVRVHLKRALDKIREYFINNNIRWE